MRLWQFSYRYLTNNTATFSFVAVFNFKLINLHTIKANVAVMIFMNIKFNVTTQNVAVLILKFNFFIGIYKYY